MRLDLPTLRPRLRVARSPGAALCVPQIDEMWGLRARTFDLQPGQCPETDRVRFGDRVTQSKRVLLLRDRSGTLRGMTCFLWEPAGRGVVLIPEYGVFDAGFRGDPMFLVGALPILASLMAEARGRPLWMAGIGYPKSMRSAARLLDPLYSLQDPELPAEARSVLRQVLRRLAGPDADFSLGTAGLPTVPEPAPAPQRRGRFWTRYEALNPDWQSGIGLVMAGQVTPHMLVRLLSDIARRRRRAGSAHSS